mmetsp:Transcript_108482/g.212571  ORF Transcript_108482/g.212571 Transcript_108482/m.212571 type:complete len:254 (+) Transcript_108482:64-825(+)
MYHDFTWEDAPLSSWEAPVVACGLYLLMVFILPKFVPAGGFASTEGALVAHNLFLCAWSLLMFVGCLREMLARLRTTDNYDWLFCEEPGPATGSGPLYFWSYMFYVSKYYEMLDTALAQMKGSSPPHFKLHVYHHALVPLIVRGWLEHRQSLQFFGLLFNTFVHTFMYAYYVCKVQKIPTPWKHWITRIQILQFLTSIALFLITLFGYLGRQCFGNRCAGTWSLWLNLGFNITLLPQFVGVLFTPARRPKKVD